MKRPLAAVALMALATLTACLPASATSTGPNASCPAGWTRVSTQGWWQKADAAGRTVVPQSLPSTGVGGHMHVETCFPLGQRTDGDIPLTVDIMGHQTQTATGDRLDVGLAPSGTSIASVPVDGSKLVCAPGAMCHQRVTITVPASKLAAGPQSIRLRYLPARHPNGDRQFTSNEMRWFNKTASSGCLEQEGKLWYTGMDYARAGIRSCLPTGPVSGVWSFRQSARSTRLPISAVQTYIDARFGADQFTGLVADYRPGVTVRSLTRTVAVDTRLLSDGHHCLQLVTQVPDGAGAVGTGVLEIPFETRNGNAPGDGAGGCFPMP